jgi:prepilin signal peptidase PulO-like enzyme (type II secretory pathway)
MFDLFTGAPAATILVTIGLIAIAAIDVRTERIHTASTIALIGMAFVGFTIDAASPTQLAIAAAAGIATMVLLLEYTVRSQPAVDARGLGGQQQIGAGDLKIIGVPVAAIAATSLPLAAMFVAVTTTLQAVFVRGSRAQALPMGPALAVASTLSLFWLSHGLFGEVI